MIDYFFRRKVGDRGHCLPDSIALRVEKLESRLVLSGLGIFSEPVVVTTAVDLGPVDLGTTIEVVSDVDGETNEAETSLDLTAALDVASILDDAATLDDTASQAQTVLDSVQVPVSGTAAVVASLNETISDASPTELQQVETLIDQIVNDVDTTTDATGEILESTGLNSLLDPVAETIGDVVVTVAEVVGDVLSDTVEPVTNAVGDLFGDTLGPVVDTVGDVLGDTLNPVGDILGDTLDPVVDTIDDTLSTIADPVEDIISPVADTVGDVVDQVEDTVTDATDVIDDTIDDVTDGLPGDPPGFGIDPETGELPGAEDSGPEPGGPDTTETALSTNGVTLLAEDGDSSPGETDATETPVDESDDESDEIGDNANAEEDELPEVDEPTDEAEEESTEESSDLRESVMSAFLRPGNRPLNPNAIMSQVDALLDSASDSEVAALVDALDALLAELEGLSPSVATALAQMGMTAWVATAVTAASGSLELARRRLKTRKKQNVSKLLAGIPT